MNRIYECKFKLKWNWFIGLSIKEIYPIYLQVNGEDGLELLGYVDQISFKKKWK